ncbi:MAG: hypothetical protein SGILL_004737 [Bacillariaceae sp.]
MALSDAVGSVAALETADAASCAGIMNISLVGGGGNASGSDSSSIDHHPPPQDLLDIYISKKAYTAFQNYTHLGTSQIYDPKMRFGSKRKKASLNRFRDDLDEASIVVKNMLKYEELDNIRKECILRDERCWMWSQQGLCGGGAWDFGVEYTEDEMDPFLNPAATRQYMEQNCCPLCGDDTIEHMELLEDCPHNTSMQDVFEEPGDVTRLFINLIRRVQSLDLKPKIHAAPVRPSIIQHLLDDMENIQMDNYKFQPGGAWVVTFDDFVQQDEVDALREWGRKHGFTRSGDAGRDSVPWRTGTEAWCTENCLSDPVVDKLWQRIEYVTGIPKIKSDFLQLLQYARDQFYRTHQDYHSHQAFSQTGARVVTFYMYLNGNDKIRLGGGTNFPHLNVTAYPKQGRALVWSNVRDDAVNEESYYARHQALRVEGPPRNMKYSATAWFHQRDFQTAPEDCRY